MSKMASSSQAESSIDTKIAFARDRIRSQAEAYFTCLIQVNAKVTKVKTIEMIALEDSKTELWRIAVQAQPIGGAANEALCEFFSQILEVPRSCVKIVLGHHTKRKVVVVRCSH